MNPSPKQNDLLEDVLAESVPADFRAGLLSETLVLVRRRRQWRQARRIMAVAALLLFISVSVWRGWASRRPIETFPVNGYELVSTQALSSDAIVSTQPLRLEETIGTVASVEVVRTVPGMNRTQLVSDEELLALAAHRLPALVRTGAHTQTLIFLAPDRADAVKMN